MNIDDLRKPLTVDQIDFRIQSINKGGYATILAYKDARVDMDTLDKVCGAMYWKREHLNGNANCVVSIWDSLEKHWVSKEDTGTESMTEKEKGLASDSFKRACFNWGIGRDLYSFPVIKVKLNDDEYSVHNDKVKQTYNLKLSDWTWVIQRDIEENISFIGAADQNKKPRFQYGEYRKDKS